MTITTAPSFGRLSPTDRLILVNSYAIANLQPFGRGLASIGTFGKMGEIRRHVNPASLDYGDLQEYATSPTETVRGNKPTLRCDTAFSFAFQGLRLLGYFEKTEDDGWWIPDRIQEIHSLPPKDLIARMRDAWRERSSSSISTKWRKLQNDVRANLGIKENQTVSHYPDKKAWFRIDVLIERLLPHCVIGTALNNGHERILYPDDFADDFNQLAYRYYIIELCALADTNPKCISIYRALKLVVDFKITEEQYCSLASIDDRRIYKDNYEKYKEAEKMLTEIEIAMKPIIHIRNKLFAHNEQPNEQTKYNSPSYAEIKKAAILLRKVFSFVNSFVFSTGHSANFFDIQYHYITKVVRMYVNISQKDMDLYISQVRSKMANELGHWQSDIENHIWNEKTV